VESSGVGPSILRWPYGDPAHGPVIALAQGTANCNVGTGAFYARRRAVFFGAALALSCIPMFLCRRSKTYGMHVSQEKTTRTSSSGPDGNVTLAELIVVLFPANVSNGSAKSTPVRVMTPATAYRWRSALMMMFTGWVPVSGLVSVQISTSHTA